MSLRDQNAENQTIQTSLMNDHRWNVETNYATAVKSVKSISTEKGPATRGLSDQEPDKAGQVFCNTIQNTKQTDNQSGMLNEKEPSARSRDRRKRNIINGKMFKSVTATMKLKENYPKCRKAKRDQKENNRNSAKKTWSEQRAECMKILGLTIDPYENKKKTVRKEEM